MIRNHHLLRKLERKFVAQAKMPHKKSLRLFEAMWEEGVLLGVLPPGDPSEGLEVDIRVARILNSCSRNSSPG
jgi:hypothetical protein